jgi:hypothetical protein
MSLLEELKSISEQEMRDGLAAFAEHAAVDEDHLQIARTLGQHYTSLAMLPNLLQEGYIEQGEYSPEEASLIGDGALLTLAILKTIAELRLDREVEL